MQLTHQAGEFDRLGERELVRIVPMRMNIPLLHTHAHISHSILHLMIIHSMMHTLTHSHNVQSIKLSTLSLLVLFFHLLFFLYSHAQSDGLASEIDRDHEAVQRTRQAPELSATMRQMSMEMMKVCPSTFCCSFTLENRHDFSHTRTTRIERESCVCVSAGKHLRQEA